MVRVIIRGDNRVIIGVKFEVRKVPSDSSEDLDAMLKKAKAELAAQA